MNPISGANDVVIGLDLGGTKISGGAFKIAQGCEPQIIFAQEENRYKKDFQNFASMSNKKQSLFIEDLLVASIKRLETSANQPIRGVGIVSAGFIENGVVVDAANIGMKNYPLEANLRKRSKLDVKLMRDSWAPAFAAPIEAPSILFSVGTGFGGVSCEADKSIPIAGYTIRHWPMWLPRVFVNDDPGYALSLSPALCAEIIDFGLAAFKGLATILDSARMADVIFKAAADNHKATPSKFALTVARLLVGKDKIPFDSNEVFADFVGGADFAGLLYRELLGGESIPPEELDQAASGDAKATAAFFLHGAFIGEIIHAMQKERKTFGLEYASEIFGTGSGFNHVNHQFVSNGILARLRSKGGETIPVPDGIRLLQSPDPKITLAAYGAAIGFLCRAADTDPQENR